MQPADPQPAPAKKFPLLAALIGAAAVGVAVPTVQSWEGRELVPYRDIVGIWTVCDGDTKNVVPGRRESEASCDARLEQQLLAHAKPVMRCAPQLADRPNALAASISLAYNVGTGGWIGIEAERKLPKRDAALDGWRGGYCGSTAAVRFRQEQWRAGCDAFMGWNKAGGRVVRGLDRRRRAERDICLRDAK